MSARQLDLIGKPKRRSPRVLMYVSDAGDRYIQFTCFKCGFLDRYHGYIGTVSENKRGRPCPRCNPEPRP